MLAVGQVCARTWYVEQDGSGDFTVIQDAVDAAGDGDTVAIGPGRYEEYQTIYVQGYPYGDVYVFGLENFVRI